MKVEDVKIKVNKLGKGKPTSNWFRVSSRYGQLLKKLYQS